MKQSLLQEKYPVLDIEIEKSETTFNNVDEIIEYFRTQIENHPVAKFISIFDHYAHTRSLEEGTISDEILDAKNIVFCFGIALPNPHVMAVRPRSIGVTETKNSFVIAFMEAPMPIANNAMEAWAKGVRNKETEV